MGQQTDLVLVYTTFESIEHAKTVGRALIEARLAACMNIIPAMTAIYEWQGEIQECAESIMVIKTRRGNQAEVLKRTKELHPYETPALIVLDPAHADEDFASWIAEQTSITTTPSPGKKKRTL